MSGLTFLQRRIVFERDVGICAECRADCEKIKRVYWAILDSPAQWFYADLVGYVEARSMWEADHIKERALGGSDSLNNLQTLCRKCHRIKTNEFLTKSDEKRVPFNCLVPPETLLAIRELSATLGLSQGDVVVAGLMALRMQEQHVGGPPKKVSKKAAHVAELKASDPLAEIMEREDIEHGNMELPSSGSIATLDVVGLRATEGRGKASVENWRAGRKPIPKPGGRQ